VEPLRSRMTVNILAATTDYPTTRQRELRENRLRHCIFRASGHIIEHVAACSGQNKQCDMQC
jgi:hypothetical protein